MIDYDTLPADAERDDRRCVVGALICDGTGRIFVHRRSWDGALFPGCWGIVGGHVEPGERLLEGLAREVRAETGWDLADVRTLAAVVDWQIAGDDAGNPNPRSVGRRREFDFLVNVKGDLAWPRLEAGKQIEFRWVGPDDIGLLDENRGADQGLVRRTVERAFELAYYMKHTVVTDPGPFAETLSSLPATSRELREVVHGIVAHRDTASLLYGVEMPQQRRPEAETRYVDQILERVVELDARPLTHRREPARRFLGSCRDFAALLCAMYRAHDVPARMRCGSAAYWIPGAYVDHWVCEYWEPMRQRWRLADAEIGEPERGHFDIAFDGCDVPRDQFIAAGRAWQMCRHGAVDPSRFGSPPMRCSCWTLSAR